MGQLYAPFGRLAKRASRLWRLAGRCLAEKGHLSRGGDLRAEHSQHPIQLLLFASSLRSDRLPQSAQDSFIQSVNRVARRVHEPTVQPRAGARDWLPTAT